jgi:hypothetical protein
MASRVSRLILALFAALCLGALLLPACASAFGFLPGGEGFKAEALTEGEAVATQAGSHPTALKLGVGFKAGVNFSEADVKDLSLQLPPGLIENPSAVGVCSQAAFHTPRTSPFEESRSGESCPDRSQVGIATLTTSVGGGETRSFGIFNLEPPPGAPSELGFSPYGSPITFIPEVRQADGEYGLTLQSRNITQLFDTKRLELTIWGNPWSVLHDAQRGNCLKESEPSFGWAKCSIGPPKVNPATAYLTLPTSCEGPLPFSALATAWQGGATAAASTTAHALESCGSLAFNPQPAGRLSDPRASSPSGYEFEIAQDTSGILDPTRLAASAVRKAVVQLPEGVSINPSVGAGLGVCTPAQ